MKSWRSDMIEIDCLNYLLSLYNKTLATKHLSPNEEAEYFFLIENLQYRITKLEDDAA